MVDTPTPEILGMSDEDFLKMNAPPSGGAEAVSETPVVETPVVETPVVTATEESAPVIEGAAQVESEAAKPEEGADKDKPAVASEEDPNKDKTAPVGSEAEKPKTEGENKGKEEEVVTPPNYEEFYNQIMTPFKANGKMISLKTPDEAIKLMQMGANYTRKIQ